MWSTFLVSVYMLQMKLGLFNLSPKLRVQSWQFYVQALSRDMFHTFQDSVIIRLYSFFFFFFHLKLEQISRPAQLCL